VSFRLASCLLVLSAASCSRHHDEVWAGSASAQFRTKPIALMLLPTPVLEVPRLEWEQLTEAIRREQSAARSPAALVHALMCFGPGLTVAPRGDATVVRATLVLTDARLAEGYFGAPHLVRTRYGVRFLEAALMPEQSRNAEESHPHQVLAALSQAGVNPDALLVLSDGKRFTLADVLRDLLGTYDQAAHELEWSVFAIAAYLDPRASWTDHLGVSRSLSSVAADVLNRSFEGAACGGAHLLMAQLLCAQALRDGRTESVELRELEGRIREAAIALANSQLPDGSWTYTWYQGGAAPPTRTNHEMRLHLTGHLLECLLSMPASYAVDSAALERAATYLWSHLPPSVARWGKVKGPHKSICPHTHAWRALSHLITISP
jgi:hypothetical protein